jgi:hypothetical protein
VDLAQDVDQLRRCLACAVDGFGEALADFPMVVDERVLQAGEREGGEAGHGVINRALSGRDLLQQPAQQVRRHGAAWAAGLR